MFEINAESETVYLQHLSFIQTVVARQGSGNSFLLKGWALTVSSAFYGFAVDKTNWKLAMVGLLSPIGFWLLDTYYLRQERLFRCLYIDVIDPNGEVPPLSMDTRKYKVLRSHKTRWWRVMFSATLWTFYFGLAAVGLLIAIATAP